MDNDFPYLLDEDIAGYYSADKFAALRNEAAALTERFRSLYSKLAEDTACHSECIKLYYSTGAASEISEQPFSIGSYFSYIISPGEPLLSPDLDFLLRKGRSACSLHCYDLRTLRPVVSCYPYKDPSIREFHIIEGYNVFNVKYKAHSGKLYSVSKESYDSLGQPEEYFVTEYDPVSLAPLIRFHYHYRLIGGRITSVAGFWNYDMNKATDPPYSFADTGKNNPRSFLLNNIMYNGEGRIKYIRSRNREWIGYLGIPWLGGSI